MGRLHIARGRFEWGVGGCTGDTVCAEGERERGARLITSSSSSFPRSRIAKMENEDGLEGMLCRPDEYTAASRSLAVVSNLCDILQGAPKGQNSVTKLVSHLILHQILDKIFYFLIL